MPGWFGRGCLVVLAVCVLSTPAPAAAAGPDSYDVRRGAIYGVDAEIGSDCDVSPAQDLELEWNGERIPWEFLDVDAVQEGGWRITGTYRVPQNSVLGHERGPEVFCWDLAHTSRNSVFNFSPGGVVTYDASVSPVQTAAGFPVTVEGYVLPSHCGSPSNWHSRLSIRFDGQPRPWTSIDGSSSEDNRLDVAVVLIIPDGAAVGAHEWSIWCRDWDPSGGYEQMWTRTVSVIAALPAQVPAGVSASNSPLASSSAQSPTASPSAPGTASPGATSTTGSPAVTPIGTPSRDGGLGWPRTKAIGALPKLSDMQAPSPWFFGGLLLIALLLFLLIGFPSELFNKTFEANEPAIRRWLRLPPTRDRTLHPVRWPIVTAFVVGGAILMALAEPSPIFSRETLVTVLALIVAVPLTGLVYSYVMERHARRHGASPVKGKLKPVYPAIAVAVVCAALSRIFHFVPVYVYGLILAYTAVAARTVSRRQQGAGVLKATAVLVLTAALSWISWQVWFAGAPADSTGFMTRLLETTLGFIAVLCLEAPLLALLPLRFLDGRALWDWSKPLWLSTYSICIAAFLIVLVDFGATGTEWSAVITMAVLFLAFGIISFAFWSCFAIRARRLEQGKGRSHRAIAMSAEAIE